MWTKKMLSYGDLSTYRTELMGISICAILLCHLQECQIMHGKTVTMLARLLAMNIAFVDVFLFLSGIGLYFSYTRNSSPGMFYRKRIMRLLPSYIFVTLPYWIWKDVIMSRLGWSAVLADISFYSFISGGVKRFWFIFAIIVLYAFFPAIYKFIYNGKSSALRLIILIAVSCIVGEGFMLTAPNIYANLKIVIDRIPIFLLGIFIGDKVKKNEPVSMKCVVVLTLLGSILIALSRMNRFSLNFEPFIYYIYSVQGLIVLPYLVLMLKLWTSPCILCFLKNLGSITLETYLFHSLWKNVFDDPSTLGMYLFACVLLPILCGYFVHKCIVDVMSFGGKNASV